MRRRHRRRRLLAATQSPIIALDVGFAKGLVQSVNWNDAMASEFSALDLLAIGVFFAAWVAYETLFEGSLRPPNALNSQMRDLRCLWMHALLRRDNRIVDSTLVGHTIHSAAFFASTTMLVLAGLIGVLGSADQVYAAIANISVLLGGGQRLFEWKLVLLISIFIYAFFKFTWALRQFNYFCAVIGSAPDAPADPDEAETYANRMAAVLTNAARALNSGVRSYYFAFAAFGWFIHPIAFMLATSLMVLVMVRRQLASPTAQALRQHTESLNRLHRR
jgi:uncharacterized membrane protein